MPHKELIMGDLNVFLYISWCNVSMWYSFFVGKVQHQKSTGGAIISVVLFILKRTVGYEKPVRKGFKVKWVHVPPTRS